MRQLRRIRRQKSQRFLEQFATWCRKTYCADAHWAARAYFRPMKQNLILDVGGKSHPADHAASSDERALVPALLRGWRCRCPNCGGGPMMNGYLKVRQNCVSCGEDLHHHRADDLPAWATILIVGHVLVSSLLTVEVNFAPPLWVHWSLWPAITLGLTMWLLPRVKGMVVAFQWAKRMHGFDDRNGAGHANAGQLDRPAP